MPAGTHNPWSATTHGRSPGPQPSSTVASGAWVSPVTLVSATAQPIETELGQAQFRLRIAALIVLLSTVVLGWRQPDALARAIPPSLAYLAFAWVWVHAVTWPVSARARQWLALVLDHLLVGWCLWQGGVGQGLLIWAPMVVSIGHGLRFGANRGLMAAALGGLVMLVVTQQSPHWAQSGDLRVGLALAAIIAPVYAARLAQRIERARVSAHELAQTYAHRAAHDPLTGLLNRHGLEDAFRACSTPEGRSQRDMGLLYLDLDGFKRVNDEMGHEVGDQVLQTVGEHLRLALRASDPICRLGGDEFVVLMPMAAERNTLELIAHKLSQAVAQARLECGLSLPLGVSIGVCLVRADVALADAVRRGDQLMYAAKRRGKQQHQFGVCQPRTVSHCQAA